MKLRYSPTSPYVRKVLVTAYEVDLADRIQKVETNVWDPNSDIGTDNPLGKVPALVTDSGVVLCDSPLICEYLDSLHQGQKLIPAEGADRYRVLNLAALGNGVMDAAVARVIELRQRPEKLRWNDWLVRQKGKIGRSLEALEIQAAGGTLNGPVHLGSVVAGCALGYLDLRFPEDGWRDGRKALAEWYEQFSLRPSMKATEPPK